MLCLRTPALVALTLLLSTHAVEGQEYRQLPVCSGQCGDLGLIPSQPQTANWQLPTDPGQRQPANWQLPADVQLASSDRSSYRDFQLGGTLLSVTTLSGAPVTDAKTVHQRPALIQQLTWRPSYFVSASTLELESVREVAFSFYNDQLFRIVIDYERARVEGLTDADMIEAVSAIYGVTSKRASPKAGAAVTPLERDSGTLVARWEDADHSVGLYRSSYATGFRLILTSRSLDALARTAAAQAARMDEREAPQRELARQQKDANETTAAQEKARIANKTAFKP